MWSAPGISARVWGLARGAERHWLRPLLQRLRIPRFRRRQSRRPSAATEELLVALLRTRLRAEGAGAVATDRSADTVPATGTDVDALVHGLLGTVVAGPRDGSAGDPAPVDAVTLPIGFSVAPHAAEGRRRAA